MIIFMVLVVKQVKKKYLEYLELFDVQTRKVKTFTQSRLIPC